MPIYEYKCGNCNSDFERIVKSGTPDSEISCPKCKQLKAQKKLSKFSFGSKTSSGDFKSAPSSGGCGSCSSHNCGSCHH
jgi:putative FmdB family regulatory protein